jgi:hypothetical protein
MAALPGEPDIARATGALAHAALRAAIGLPAQAPDQRRAKRPPYSGLAPGDANPTYHAFPDASRDHDPGDAIADAIPGAGVGVLQDPSAAPLQVRFEQNRLRLTKEQARLPPCAAERELGCAANGPYS